MPITVDKTQLDKELLVFCNLVKRRLRADWDIVLGITGEEGCGKSTLAMLLAGLIDEKFDFEKNVSFLPDAEEITKEFTSLKKYQCYVIDEAIRALYKLNFMTNLQQTLIQMWATERFQNKATIMVIPRFRDLTENFRNHRVKIWIHVITRGHAVVYIRDDDPHTMDPWQFDYMQKYKQKVFGRTNVAAVDLNKRLNVERKMRNYLFDFKFPDMDPIDKNTYESLKHKSRLDFMDSEKERKVGSEGRLTKQYRESRDWMLWFIANKINKGSRTEMRETLCEQLSLSKATYKTLLKKGDEVEKEKMDREERLNTYVGVDRFLEQALEVQKDINKNEIKKVKGTWEDVGV